MKRNRKWMGLAFIMAVLLLVAAASGFAQGKKGETSGGYGKTPDDAAVEETKKADGRVIQGEKEPGPPPIDTLAHASGSYYYETDSLTDEELWSAIAEFRAATVVATVNRDHSPNSAFVIPGYVEEGVLVFGLAENQTAKNLMERDWAVITVLVPYPEKETPYEGTKYKGARVVVERISDEAEIQRLMETYDGYPSSIYMRVVDVLPMG